VVYSRVSTDVQERDGTSLDTQERAGVEVAQRNNWHAVGGIRDAAGGVGRGAAAVIVASAVDRLSRNQNHIGILFDEVQQAGARLELVTEQFEDTAIGRFILAARAFIGEGRREEDLERATRRR